MKNTLLRIIAQVEENYGWANGKSQKWKSKGSQEFQVYVSADSFMYEKKSFEMAVESTLKEKSDLHTRYSLLEMALVFHTPTVLDTDDFDKKVVEANVLRYPESEMES